MRYFACSDPRKKEIVINSVCVEGYTVELVDGEKTA